MCPPCCPLVPTSSKIKWLCGAWCARRDSNPHDVTHCHLKAARLPIPPRALGMSGPSGRINGADVTNRPWGDKSRLPPYSVVSCDFFCLLARARLSRQHLLDLDRDPVAVDQHDAGGNRQAVGEHLDLVGLGGIQFDDGAAG